LDSDTKTLPHTPTPFLFQKPNSKCTITSATSILSLTSEVTIMFVPRKILEAKLLTMLTEDVGQGDITTSLLIEAASQAKAQVVARQSGIIAGIEEATILLEALGLEAKASVKDGQEVKKNQVLLKISGDTRTILTAERTLLNVLSRMSGIATATRNLVDKLRKAKLKTRIACTRKTAPGLLYFDKKAVHIGGGDAHRFHLDDMILIKDNHIAVVGNLQKAIETARKNVSFSKKIEVEVSTVDDVLHAYRAGADIVLLDNFPPKKIREAVDLLKKEKCYGKILLEASGGITAGNLLEYASTGVDYVSLGELTQSPRALDISLDIASAKKSEE
jgi:nicotinate-nucleotide pyrophosphorylase (carboxylating)